MAEQSSEPRRDSPVQYYTWRAEYCRKSAAACRLRGDKDALSKASQFDQMAKEAEDWLSTISIAPE